MTRKRTSCSPGSAWVSLGLQRYRELTKEQGGLGVVTSKGAHAKGSDGSRRALVAVLRAAALALVPVEERPKLRRYRLFEDAFCATSHVSELLPLEVPCVDVDELGLLLEVLLSEAKLRKQSGMFYTPRLDVDDVVSRAVMPFSALTQPLPRIVDPACGGGAFLFGVARALERLSGGSGQPELRLALFNCLYGYDIEPLAVAVSELSLAIWAGAYQKDAENSAPRFRHADSLASLSNETFELVIGNPPWVAYAGRATQPITLERRRWLAQQYQAFHGYPTLHACFIELGARLAPRGRVALLVPSPVADLDGYRPMRRTLTRTHRVNEELIEYGQDAFEDVVQPCFALLADGSATAESSDAPFRLVERARRGGCAETVQPPNVLLRLRELAPFPSETFRELGFQTNTIVTKNLLLRNASPEPPFEVPLLEGRDVTEFRVGLPRLYLNPDRDLLRRVRCKLRSNEDYQEVKFVVRQTAKYPIAAVHSGLAFRNSLIAGFESEAFNAAVMVGLLNSVLLRALHMAAQRDARQKTFPQVKLSHLRGLPAPSPSVVRAAKLGHWVQGAGQPLGRAERTQLDAMVFDWYKVSADEAAAVERFYLERCGGVS